MGLNCKPGRFWLAVMVSLVLFLAIGSGLEARVRAQGDPTPPPQAAEGAPHGELDGPQRGRIEGDAVWTVGDQSYTGEFPDGLRFEIAAASDQGTITSARVVWSHAPGTNTRRSAGARLDPDIGRWVAVWEPGTSQVPPWVLVRYHWELTDAQGNRYITPERDEVYADVANADQWGHLESEDVVVYWIGLPESYGQQAIAAMAARREFYRQAWGGLLPYRPRVILYGWSARDQYQMLFNRPVFVGSSYVAGTTSGDWGGTVQLAGPGSSPEDTAYGTVLHEVAHLYQNQFARVTVDWFIEGDAEFFSLARSTDYVAWGRRAAAQRRSTILCGRVFHGWHQFSGWLLAEHHGLGLSGGNLRAGRAPCGVAVDRQQHAALRGDRAGDRCVDPAVRAGLAGLAGRRFRAAHRGTFAHAALRHLLPAHADVFRARRLAA